MKAKFTSMYSACLRAMLSFLGFPNDNVDGYAVPYVHYRQKDNVVSEVEEMSSSINLRPVMEDKKETPAKTADTEVSYSGLEFNFISDIFPGDDVVSKIKNIEKDNRRLFGNK